MTALRNCGCARRRWMPALVILFASQSSSANGSEPPFRIAAYLPDYRMMAFEETAAAPLTDLIIFSAEPTASGALDRARLTNAPWQRLRTFKTRAGIRLLLCVGGWNRSHHFPAMTAEPAARQRFVAECVACCLNERFDGVDLDWEHPRSAAEEANYAAVLTEMRAAFTPHGLTLSIARAGWQRLPASAYQAVDWVHLMAYDHPGRHATLPQARMDIERLLDEGIPKEKITLGIPLYGRGIDEPNRAASYSEIRAQHRPSDEADEADGLFFNGAATVRAKTMLARRLGLNGVMAWEFGQDAAGDGSLLKLMRATADANRPASD